MGDCFAQSLEDCRLVAKDSVPAGFQVTGYVSLQGHYASWLNTSLINYPYALACDSRLVIDRSDGVSTFNFSDPNSVVATVGGVSVLGGGHITRTGVGVNFQSEAFHGFTEGACRVVSGGGSCDASEVCVLKVSNPDQGTVADCTNPNLPYPNNFQHRICCTPKEYCRDGVDNTGDGLVDCASPDCHPTTRFDVNTGTTITTPPQQCDPGSYIPGNNQSTSECVIDHEIDANGIITPIFSPHCMGPNPEPLEPDIPYYCNYGFDDDPLTHSDGFCCPEGQYYDEPTAECRDFQVCGILPEHFCGFSFPINTNSWLGQVFDNSPKWCHSHLPNLRSAVGRSEACCPVMTHGTFGYFVVDENVKIFGYE